MLKDRVILKLPKSGILVTSNAIIIGVVSSITLKS